MEEEDVFKEIEKFYQEQMNLLKIKRQKETEKNEKND